MPSRLTGRVYYVFAEEVRYRRLIGGSVVRFGGVYLDATLDLRAFFDAIALRGNGRRGATEPSPLDVDTVASVHIADHLSVTDNSRA